jgi:hypothetical protein
MNCKIGIIATFLLVCSLAGTAWAGLSETAAAGEGTPGQTSSAPATGGGQAGINSLLDRFAGVGFSDSASEESSNPSIPIAPPISETTLFSAFTRAGSLMNAYYSRSGSDNKEKITEISRSASFVAAIGGDHFVLPEAGLAAIVQEHFVGSGAVVGEASIAPIQAASSDPAVIQTTTNTVPASAPLPLPFLLTGSGLAVFLVLRKRAGMQFRQAEPIC